MTTVLSAPALAAQHAMATPFSYAQAAKTAPVNAESAIPNGASSQPNVAASSEATSSSIQDAPNANTARNQTTRAEPASGPKVAQYDGKQAPKLPTESTENASMSPIAAKEQPRHSNNEGEPAQADTRPRSAAKDSSTAPSDRSSSAEKSGDVRGGRRNRKNYREGRKDASKDSGKDTGKDTKADKEPEEEKTKQIPAVELMPAPLPSVNPWHKRASLSNTPTTSSAPQEPRTSEIGAEGKAVEGDASKADLPQIGAAQVAKTLRKGSTGTLSSGDKDDKKTSVQGWPPANHDSMSWPTLPEGEDTKLGKSQQSKPQGQEGPNAGVKQKKKWEKVPLEHSNIYPSPLPSRGGGNRGRGRGGKDTGGRGGSATAGTGTGMATNASSKGEIKPRTPQDGNSGRTGSGGRRNNSPGGSKRTTPGDATARKHSIASARDLTETTAGNSRAPQPRAKNEAPGAEQYHSSGHGNNKHYQANNHTREPSLGSKESAANGRERDYVRSDRGRGGYRGRGNHNSNSHGHSHSLSHSQANFAGTGGYGSRQGPVAFGTVNNGSGFGPGHRGGRGGGRGGQFGGRNSGPSAPPVSVHPSVNGSQPVNGGHNPRAHPPNITVDPNPLYPFAPGPYSAPPVAAPREGWSALLTRQLEYWFSPENLAKDAFLRRNMDSEGYVLLSVIMGFGRINTMNATCEDIRYAISQTDKINLYSAADGQERIRLVDSPKKWIFPAEARVNPKLEAVNPFELQTPYASSATWFGSPTGSHDAAFYSQGYAHPEAGPLHAQFSHPAMMEGMPPPAYAHSTQLTAEAPEFAPANGIATQGGNGGGASDQATIGSADETRYQGGGDTAEQ